MCIRDRYKFLLKPDILFTPQIEIDGLDREKAQTVPNELMESLVFNLGLAKLPSYWKAACPAEIRVEAGSLSQEQAQWWHQLFMHGLGEFFYTNQIEFSQQGFLDITSGAEPTTAQPQQSQQLQQLENSLSSLPKTHYQTPYLIPVGGGKDSGLTLGLLQKTSQQFDTLVLEPASPAAARLANNSQAGRQITVIRTICPTLLELNRQGYLNGHTPFSAYLAFLSTLVAHLQGHQQILVANEQSANQPNLEFGGQKINHQWSKSFEFEQLFRQYSAKYLANQPKQAEYLSFLRPLNELQIAQKFAQFPEYLSTFRSCNVGQKQDIWCGNCAKCVFVFTMLFPFVDQSLLTTKVFNRNLFEDDSLWPLFEALADPSVNKPLDCVGTDQEVRFALQLAINKYQQAQQPLPVILQQVAKILADYPPQEDLLNRWNNQHFLDEKLLTILKNNL